MNKARKIIHVDMDAFYAQIEQRDNPKYRNKPIVIGSGTKNYGIVSTCSYEARKFGIRSAMSSIDAYSKCNETIFVRQDMQKYVQESKRIRKIFYEITDKVEIASIDEAYLDVTENKTGYNSAIKIALLIKQRIYEETHLTSSVGVSYNKMLAKISSDINKPNGIFIITPDDAKEFLKELNINKIPGIGKVTYQKMQRFGMYKGKDVYDLSKEDLIKYFNKSGERIYYLIRGIDEREVKNRERQKSIANEKTLNYYYKKINNIMECRDILIEELDNVHNKMMNRDYVCKTLTIKIKYSDFQMYTRSYSFDDYITDKDELINKINDLLVKFPYSNKDIRLVGISLSNLKKNDNIYIEKKQLSLF